MASLATGKNFRPTEAFFASLALVLLLSRPDGVRGAKNLHERESSGVGGGQGGLLGGVKWDGGLGLNEDEFPMSLMVAPPVLPLIVSRMASAGKNELCRIHSSAFLRELQNFTLWAVQMFDASTKFPEGVLSGNSYHMGNFDQCVTTRVDLSETFHGDSDEKNKIYGKYCLAEISFMDVFEDQRIRNSSYDPYSMEYDPKSSAWNKIQHSGDPTKSRRDVLHWALCLPSSCSPSDIADAMGQAIDWVSRAYHNSLRVKIRVPDAMCQTDRHEERLSVYDIVFSVFSATLVILVVTATIFEISIGKTKEDATKPGMMKQLVLCFSAKKNFKSIFQIKTTEHRLDCIHGSRFMSMLLVIMGHRVKSIIGGALFNPEVVEEAYRSPGGSLMINGLIIVDTFFVYGGLLTTYFLLLELEKRKSLNLFMLCILRFLRLTPVYIMIVFFHATLFHKIGSGPLWGLKVGLERDRCINSWWTNLLYINNYVQDDQMCMFQSWYMSCDMHFFIISIFIVYLLWNKPKIGFLLLGSATFLSLAIPFFIIYNQKKDAILLPYIRNLKDIQSNENFISFYVKSHNRAGPYMVGVITGYLLYKLHNSKFKMTKAQSHIGVISCFIVGLITMVSGYLFYYPGHQYNALESAIYGSFFRISWASSIAFGLFIFMKGDLGFTQTALQWKAFIPLSRLTYCAYLVHTIIQLYHIGSLRKPEYGTVPLALWSTGADIFMTFFFSVLICLTIEAPTRAIEKVLLKRKWYNMDLAGDGSQTDKSSNCTVPFSSYG